ncbi:MAG: PqqD family protein [Oscillospiraceae bacterium]|nr:PqqD family protein [Oscillospiraceae bacterium]
MKIKEGFVLRRVLDEAIVIASGEASKNFHGMIKLNDSAADIWTWISEGLDESEIAKKLSEKYELSEEKAKEDTESMIKQMSDAGFFEI